MSGPSQLKLTPFEVAPFLDQRNLSSRFVKNERQSWFSRRGTDQDWSDDVETKRRRLMGSEEELEGTPMRLDVVSTAPEGGLSRPAPSPHQKDEAEVVMDSTFRTIVIHPGSRWLRIGRASDALPTTVPNVIARRSRSFVPSAGKGKQREVPLPAPIVAAKQPDIAMDVDAAYEAPVDPAVPLDPLSIKIKSIRGDLRARMSAFKLRGQGNGNLLASGYNASAQPETTGEYNDPSEVDWTDITGNNAKEVYIGAKALRIPNPEASGYTIRRPYSAGTLDTTGYTSQQELLGDIERIWLGTLEDELGITRAELKDYSVILIIPDLYDQIYVREMAGLILGGMGFKRMCMQQESICATFGAGLSTACVIDMGAKKISISCVEEGLVLPETRIALNYGGDDVTEFLFTLLSRVNFPYREADLARTSDWTLLETLKAKMIVLSEVDVGLNLYDFYVRIPGQKTRKYMMRVYDEPILAPYSLFSPRVIDFEKKELLRKARPSLFSQEVDDLYSLGSDITTIAMKNSTKHLVGGPTTLKFKLTPKPVGPVLPTAISSTPLITTTPSSLPLPSLIPPTTPSSLPTPPSTLIILPPALPATKASPLTQKSFSPALESSKIPLHLALVESILATSSEELQKRLAGSILIVGGTGLIHNVGFGIDSRATPILYSRAPHLSGSFAIVPSPREIDPRMLAWKGIAVLGKLDCSENLWVRTDDWERMGLRAVKERHLFFD